MNKQQKIKIIINIEKKMSTYINMNDFCNLIDYIMLSYYISFIDDPLIDQASYKNKALNYFNYIIKNLKDYPILPGSLYGFSTLLYFANILNDNRIYDDTITTISLFLEKYYHKFYFEKIYKGSLKSSVYDLINGMSGVGISVLDNTNNYNLVKNIATDLINLYIDTNYIIQKENTTNPYFYYNFNNGYIDLGMSHGIAPVLIFLSKLKMKNIIVPNLDNVIKAIFHTYANFIYNDSNFKKNIPLIPQCLIVDKKNHLQPFYDKRMSWCYGSLIIYKKLFDITNQVIYYNDQNLEFKNKISSKMDAILELDLSNYDLICSTFCHGFSGLFHIINEINNDITYNVNTYNLHFLKKELENTIWDNIDNSQYKFYFSKKEYSKLSNKYIITEDNTGYLSGVVSILIPYICSISNIPREKNIFNKILLI